MNQFLVWHSRIQLNPSAQKRIDTVVRATIQKRGECTLSNDERDGERAK
jgi:hypothetical protein